MRWKLPDGAALIRPTVSGWHVNAVEMPDGAALIRPTVSGWHVNAVEIA
jgi:hypothetical protein